jgi:hypothetical protein
LVVLVVVLVFNRFYRDKKVVVLSLLRFRAPLQWTLLERVRVHATPPASGTCWPCH